MFNRERVLVAAFVLFFFLFPLGAREYLYSTEHFDFIYSEEIEESASEVIERAEEYYSFLVRFFDRDPELKIPVYFRYDTKEYNAYYTAYPINHIVMYVTNLPRTLLTNADYPLSSTFFHELTHAFTHNIKSPFVKFLSSIFGDGVIPGNLYMNRAFIEGIAVYAESLNGEGRLNDAEALYLVNQMAEEKIKLSYLDIEGGRDIYPGANMSYILGAQFLSYLASLYGEDKLCEFVVKCYEFPISTTSLIFKSIFGIRIKDAWDDYVEKKSLKKDLKTPHTITELGNWSNLKLNDGKIYVASLSTSSLYQLKEDGSMSRIKLTQSSFDDLSFSPHLYLLPYVTEHTRSVSVFTLDGSSVRTFSDYYSALLLSDDSILLLGETDRITSLDLFSLSRGERIASFNLGRDITLWSGLALSEEEGVFIIAKGGEKHLLLVNIKDGELSLLSFPAGINVSSIALNSDETIAFSYVTDDTSSLMKYGEIIREGEEWLYKISSDEYSGGIYFPLRDENDVYFVSSFFSGKKVSILSYDSLTFIEEGPLSKSLFTIREREDDKKIEGVHYNPLRFMQRGLLLPFGLSSSKMLTSRSGLGLTYIAQDPSEKHRIVLSLGYDLATDVPFTYMTYSFKDYFKAELYSFSRNGETAVEADFTSSWKKTLSSDSRYILFSDTLSFSKEKDVAFNNYLSLSYRDIYKAGFSRHENAGWKGEISVINSTPQFALTLYFPRLLPLSGSDRMTRSIPFNLAFTIYDFKNPILKWKGDFYLFTYEVQSSISWLNLYIQNVDLMISYSGKLRPHDMLYTDIFSLSLNIGIAPLLGILSTIGWDLRIGVSYNREKTQFSFLFSLGS